MEARAAAHWALGDSRRLLVIDQLALSDRTVAELADTLRMAGNLLAHHLDLLEAAGLIERRISEGDHRRRYVSLRWDRLPTAPCVHLGPIKRVAFVCTHNSARSQFAAALWEQTTGLEAASAGSQPAIRVHPSAVRVAAEFGVDISSAQPAGYERINSKPDLLISVCDRAREAGVPAAHSQLHWSVPDPVRSGTLKSFRAAFAEITQRVGHLAEQTNQ